MPAVTIVDLDGVLRAWDPRTIATAEAAVGLPPGALSRSAFGNKDRLRRAVTGRITDERWRAEVADELTNTFGVDGSAAVAWWSEPAGAVDLDVLNVLRRHRHHRPLGLMTNATTRLRHDLNHLGLDSEFDWIFNSSELGVAKPDVESFIRVMTELALSPSELWFVDDTAMNVEAAISLGIRAHQYTSLRDLENFLVGTKD